MAGDDTKPDPLFKNVVRRPRSATERPRKEEPAPDGGHPGGGPATSAAASNKPRPSSIGKLVMGGGARAMEKENNGGEPSPSVVEASSKVKKKATTDFFPDKAHVTDALRTILASLDASDPTRVYEKHMPPSDRNRNQNRLLMSCKCESKRASFASIFTETEMPLVHRPEPLFKTDQLDEEDDEQQQQQQGTSTKQRSTVRGLAVQA